MKSEVSALMDGALDESTAALTLDAMGKAPELRRDWETWHLIGDTLRHTEGAGASVLSAGFSDRFMQALEDEPTVLAPPPRKAEGAAAPRLRLIGPLAASVMGIGAVVWVAQTLGLGMAPPVVAVASTHTLVAQPVAPVIASADRAPPPGVAQAMQPVSLSQSGGQMREYVVAHEGYSPGAAMQGLARYQRGMAETRQGSGQ